MRHRQKLCWPGSFLLACIISAVFALPAQAESLAQAATTSPSIARLLGDSLDRAALSQLRGGFLSNEGLHYSFSFESVTRLNGEVLAQANVLVPMMTLAGSRTGLSLADTLATTPQGMNPELQSSAAFSSLSPILIQNSLDNQRLETLNVLNLQVYGIRQLSAAKVHNTILPTIISSLNR